VPENSQNEVRGSGSPEREVIKIGSGRASSNREVTQPDETVFKIKAGEWNNVPRIVYEAIVAIVNTLDENARASRFRAEEVSRQFKESRFQIATAE